MTPATKKGRAARAHIVHAATDVVSERGVAGMSMDKVRARARCGNGQLYHYFHDRDELVQAVFDTVVESELASQRDFLVDLDSRQGVDRWLTALGPLRRGREARQAWMIWSLVRQSTELDSRSCTLLVDALGYLEQQLRCGIERMQDAGSISAGADPGRLATTAIALLQGGALLAQVRRDPGQLEVAVDGVRSLLCGARPNIRSGRGE
jgi:AcrR family transcriptional regulator